MIDRLARRIEQAIAPGPEGERELELREVAKLLSRWGCALAAASVARKRAGKGPQRNPTTARSTMAARESKPTQRQLRYLRQLAERSGTSFTPPATRRQASEQIEQLKQRSRSPGVERRQDRQAVSRGLAEQQPASSVRDDEISGYGAECQWLHSTRAPKSA